MRQTDRERWDVVVVGGGLAGLTAAASAARCGARVALVEGAPALGGRARTRQVEGFALNLGPHALYRGGVGEAVLEALDVTLEGGVPDGKGSLAVMDGTCFALPAGVASLLGTRLLSWRAKLEAARRLSALARIDASAWAGRPYADWLDAHIADPRLRLLFEALARVSSYCDDPERHDAAAALAQARRALVDGVRYLDGGWQSIVRGLAAALREAGGSAHVGVAVDGLLTEGAQVAGVRLRDGRALGASAVVVAGGPDLAVEIAARGAPEGEALARLRRWRDEAIPVHAATLDVALSSLPRPEHPFALGLDEPTYVSVHSHYARLAPPGAHLVHVMRYLRPGRPTGEAMASESAPSDPVTLKRSLEATLERIQPGWREACVHARFLPHVLVEHALPTAAQGGLAGRPGLEVPGLHGLFVAGDWVGQEGRLAEASLASGRAAGERAAAVAREAASGHPWSDAIAVPGRAEPTNAGRLPQEEPVTS